MNSESYPIKLITILGALLGALLVALACNSFATAQCIDWTPGSHLPGIDGNVLASAVFDDGSGNGPELYVGGDFLAAGDVAARHIARWNGTRWAAVGAGVEGAVHSLLVWDDGGGAKLWAGSELLNSFDSVSRVLAAWNGVAWTPVIGGAETYSVIEALAAFDDGSGPALYVSGRFGTINGVATPFLEAVARFDGAQWSIPGAGILSQKVNTLVVHDDGSGPALFAGGISLRTSPTTGALRPICRWDGTAWSYASVGWLDGGQCASFTERSTSSGSIELYSTGFHTLNNLSTTLMRWDGSGWQSVSPSNLGPVSKILSRPQPGVDSLVYVSVGGAAGGPFPSRTVATWDGAQYSILGANPPSTNVNTFALYDEGVGEHVFVGAALNPAGSSTDPRGVARLDGATWNTVGPGSALDIEFIPTELVVYDDGSGRAMYGVGLTNGTRRLARWTGQTWIALGGAFNDAVRALTVFDDGIHGPQLYVGGLFTNCGGFSMNRLARWDGVAWQPLGSGVALVNTAPAEVRALAVHDFGAGPRLVIGGKFDLAGGAPALRIATWDGASFSPVGSGMNNHVDALAEFDDGSGMTLYAGGEFSNAGGVATPNIARWNGSAWSALPTSPNQAVTGFLVHDDGGGRKLYATGSFTAVGAIPAQFIARFDGTNWESLPVQLSAIGALATFDDGEGGGPKLFSAADFFDGTAWRPGVQRWDGSTFAPVAGAFDVRPAALAVLDDSTGNGAALFAAGSFHVSGAFAATRIARYARTGAPGCTSSTGVAFCAGDGSATACPCANNGASGRGCNNSASSGGAVLVAEGQSMLDADSVTLRVQGTTPFGAMLFFQGTAQANGGNGTAFGDGLRCVGGAQLRLAIRLANAGQASFGHGIVGDASVSHAGLLPHAWSTRHYQVWYRDAQNFCTSSNFNLSNALTLRWAP